MEEELDREQKTILIVDDEQPIREILVYNLKKEGYNVIEAEIFSTFLKFAFTLAINSRTLNGFVI